MTITLAAAKEAEAAARAREALSRSEDDLAALRVAISMREAAEASLIEAEERAKQLVRAEIDKLKNEGVAKWRAEDAPLLANVLRLQEELAEAVRARMARLSLHQSVWNRRATLAAELGIKNVPGPCPTLAHLEAETLVAEFHAGKSPSADLRDLARAVGALFEMASADLFADFGPERTIEAIIDGSYAAKRRAIFAQRDAEVARRAAEREAQVAAAENAKRLAIAVARRGGHYTAIRRTP